MKKGGKGATSKNAPMKRHAKTTVPALAMPQYVEGDLRFYVTDGTYISSYKELAKTLDAMHITIFSFHVNQQKIKVVKVIIYGSRVSGTWRNRHNGTYCIRDMLGSMQQGWRDIYCYLI